MKYLITVLEIFTLLWFGEKVAFAGIQELPYVYTQWKHFTVKDGLPNDHVFAVKANKSEVWVGTEDGLACIDKKT